MKMKQQLHKKELDNAKESFDKYLAEAAKAGKLEVAEAVKQRDQFFADKEDADEQLRRIVIEKERKLLTEQHDTELRKAVRAAVEKHRAEFDEQIESEKIGFEEERKQAKANFDIEREELLRIKSVELEDTKRSMVIVSEQQIMQLEKKKSEEMNELKRSAESSILEVKREKTVDELSMTAKFNEEREALRRTITKRMREESDARSRAILSEMSSDNALKFSNIQKYHADEIAEINGSWEKRAGETEERLTESHRSAMMQMKEEFEGILISVKRRNGNVVDDMERKICLLTER